MALTVIVNRLAPALNAMPFTSVTGLPEREMPVMFETANVAVSDGPLGMVGGIQFAAVFQSPEVGFAFQVALPAKPVACEETTSNSTVEVRRSRRAPNKRALTIDKPMFALAFILF